MQISAQLGADHFGESIAVSPRVEFHGTGIRLSYLVRPGTLPGVLCPCTSRSRQDAPRGKPSPETEFYLAHTDLVERLPGFVQDNVLQRYGPEMRTRYRRDEFGDTLLISRLSRRLPERKVYGKRSA